jgi:CRISPR-associated protein Csd2
MNRIDFTLIVEAINSNPNGDPDQSNRPRTDNLTGKGIITDVCIKRKVRDYIVEEYGLKDGYDILIRNENLFDEKTESLGDDINKICSKYIDIRLFGSVIAKKGSSQSLRGPVQIATSNSIYPVNVVDMTITRQAPSGVKDKEKENHTFGQKSYISHGVYKINGTFSPHCAKKAGTTDNDIKVFFDAISNLFKYDASAARVGMSVKGLYIFEHSSENGDCSRDKLWDSIKIYSEKESPACWEDYKVEILDAPIKVRAIL